jgi:hypothetical protein
MEVRESRLVEDLAGFRSTVEVQLLRNSDEVPELPQLERCVHRLGY